MAWYKLTPVEPGEVAHFFYSGDPDDGAVIEQRGYEIYLTPSQRTQLAYLLLTGKPMPKSKEEAAYNLTHQYREKTNN
jgi:hypothetical protein